VTTCLICGATNDITVEHIIPQTLWRRFGVDPNGEGDVAKTRTTLCKVCNGATSKIHQWADVMDLIQNGQPVTRTALAHLAEWTFWVTLLLGLANGRAVVPEAEARDLLRRRFASSHSVSIPKGLRVYAAVTPDLGARPANPVSSHAVALVGDPTVYTDSASKPIGHRAHVGMSLQAATAIGLGTVVLLVLARTHPSGPDHETRVDRAVATIGLTRIHPPTGPVPTLSPTTASVEAAHLLFVKQPLAATDLTLLPEATRRAVEALTR
jgi:hypothetical protein